MKQCKYVNTLLLLAGLLLLSACGARDVVTGDRDAGGWIDDKGIALGIEKDFLADDLIHYMDFSAYSYGGHVYLVGVYADRVQVDRAVKIAKSYEGVKRVSTYFLPKEPPGECNVGERVEIGTNLRHKIFIDKSMWGSDITVEVVKCSVVLIGYVENAQQKATAEEYARTMKNVANVKSFLTLRP